MSNSTNPSNSTSRLLWDYFRTRFPAWLVLSLSLLCLLPRIASGQVSSVVEFALALGMAILLVAEFRLWDDLSDREQDCREDPSRVLCRTESLRPFLALLLLFMMGNCGLVAWQCPWPSLAMLLALHVLLATWYAVRGYLQLGPVINYHLVLLKYPAFGFVLGCGPGATNFAPLFPSLAVVYLGLCIAEVLHDARLRVRRSAWICLGLELLLLIGIIVAWTLIGGEGNS